MSFMYETFLNDTKLLVFIALFLSLVFTLYVTVNIITKLKQNKLIYPYMIYQLIVVLIQFLAITKLIATPDMYIHLIRIMLILSVFLESLFMVLVFSLILENTPSLSFMLAMIAIPFVIMNIIIIKPELLFQVVGEYKVSYEMLYYLEGIYKYAVALITLFVIFVFIYRIKGKILYRDLLLSFLILIPLLLDIESRYFYNGEFVSISYILLFTNQIILLYTLSQKWAFNLLKTIQRNTLNIISDGVLIINNYGTIIYSNNNGLLSYFDIITSENQLIGELESKVIDFDRTKLKLKLSKVKENIETEFKTVDNKYYVCNINKIKGEHNNFLGVIISFNEITEYKLLIEAMQEKNENLYKVNEELQGQEKIINNINRMKKEEKISQDIRDLLANTMTQILTSLKASEILLYNDSDKAKNNLNEVMHVAKDYLKKVRKMVSNLKESKGEVND